MIMTELTICIRSFAYTICRTEKEGEIREYKGTLEGKAQSIMTAIKSMAVVWCRLRIVVLFTQFVTAPRSTEPSVRHALCTFRP
jgi:hypothetical protein